MTTETETPTLRHVPGGYVREDAYPSKAGPPMAVEFDREDDGRFIADVVDLPGVMAYGATREEAAANAFELAARVLREDAAQIAGNGPPDANEAPDVPGVGPKPGSVLVPNTALVPPGTKTTSEAPKQAEMSRAGMEAHPTAAVEKLAALARQGVANAVDAATAQLHGIPSHPTPCAGCDHPEHPAETPNPPHGDGSCDREFAPGRRCHSEPGHPWDCDESNLARELRLKRAANIVDGSKP